MFVYGGPSGKAEDLNEGYSAFARITESSRTFSPSSPGVPIAYKFRRLADSQLAQISLTTQYTLENGARGDFAEMAAIVPRATLEGVIELRYPQLSRRPAPAPTKQLVATHQNLHRYPSALRGGKPLSV